MRYLFDLIVAILAAPGRWMLTPFRYYFRAPALPAFTINLDDTEAKWEQDALEEWDRAFQAETGFLPAFSRLEADRLKGLSDLQTESEMRRRQILERDHRFDLQAPGTPIYCSPQDLHYVVMKDRLEHASPNPFLPPANTPFAEQLARYNELTSFKTHGD